VSSPTSPITVNITEQIINKKKWNKKEHSILHGIRMVPAQLSFIPRIILVDLDDLMIVSGFHWVNGYNGNQRREKAGYLYWRAEASQGAWAFFICIQK
jgi:hypothetical protein